MYTYIIDHLEYVVLSLYGNVLCIRKSVVSQYMLLYLHACSSAVRGTVQDKAYKAAVSDIVECKASLLS